MTGEEIKRAISLAITGLGLLGGLGGCVMYAGMMFVVGANDSPQEVWALTFAFATPFFACVLAIWQRVVAGLWMVFAGLFLTYGLIAQRTYMIQVRHFTTQPTVEQTIRTILPVSLILVGLGLFFVITGVLKWPRLLRSGDK